MRYTEKRLPFSGAPADDRNLPDVHLGLFDDVLVFDHVEKVHFLNMIATFFLLHEYYDIKPLADFFCSFSQKIHAFFPSVLD